MRDSNMSLARPLVATQPLSLAVLGQTKIALLVGALVLFWLSNPFEFLIKGIVPGEGSVTDPATMRAVYQNGVLQLVVKAGLFVSCAIPVLLEARLACQVMLRSPLLCLFVLYTLASVLWSDTPANSLNDFAYLVVALLAGISIVLVFDADEAARIWAYAGIVIAVLSVLTVIVLPAYGLHQASEGSQGGHAGAWRGVYIHKNILGQVAATFFLVYVFQGRQLFRSRLMQVAAPLAMLGLVVGSGSASTVVLIALCSSAYLVFFVARGMLQFAAIVVAPIALGFLASYQGQLLEMLGRDADLSGRTEIWAAAYRVFIERFWLGYGYGSATMGGLTSYMVARFQAQNTHNGYIDLALATGVVGSALFYGAICFALYRAIRAQGPGGHNSLLFRTLFIFDMGWAFSSLSEVAFRPNTPMGAMGFAGLVVICNLSLPRYNEPLPSPLSDEDDHGPGLLTSFRPQR